MYQVLPKIHLPLSADAESDFDAILCATEPPDDLPKLLTVEQAAALLQMSVAGIRSYIYQGKLKAFRIAGLRHVRILRDELMKLLEPAREEDLSARHR